MIHTAPTLLAVLLLVVLASPLAAQDTEADPHVVLFRKLVSELEATAKIIESITSAERARSAIPQLSEKETRNKRLMEEWRKLGRPTPEAQKTVAPEMSRFRQLLAVLDSAPERLKHSPAIWREMMQLDSIRKTEEDRRSNCKTNLTLVIWEGIKTQRARGNFPGFGTAFYRWLLDTPKVYEQLGPCLLHRDSAYDPESPKFDPRFATWSNGPSLPMDSTFPVFWDPTLTKHGDVRCVLFGDGHYELLTEEAFQKRLTTWTEKGWRP